MSIAHSVEREKLLTVNDPESNFAITFAGMNFGTAELKEMETMFAKVIQGMADIEDGKIKNPDEKRKVTHFTDREEYLGSELFHAVETFADDIKDGKIVAADGKKFTACVINGIGGSALGPQLMQFAVNGPYWNELSEQTRRGYLKIYFLDNTDPAGFADMAAVIEPQRTLCVTISKSGGTQETKNNLIALEQFYKNCSVDFAAHAAAITMEGSELDRTAKAGKWLKVFPMADSIGGRTSETSIVGHLPAALTGVDFAAFIKGACHMDELTRKDDIYSNPAYLMSAAWYIATNGVGDRNMVICPYSDRLILLSRYLQQLVMESLGKELDLDGNVVHQGLNVFGNKGGTDAHAFIQQLNDGRDDFFITFIESLENAAEIPINGTFTMGDYLHAFLDGLSDALTSKKRQVIKITLERIDAYNLGLIIALYERAVAAYAELININAFHQPGVQAYKLAAKSVLELQDKVFLALPSLSGLHGSAATLAKKIGVAADDAIKVAGILDKLVFNPERGIIIRRKFNPEDNDYIYSII